MIAWDTVTPEHFRFMRFVWDVREAKVLLSKKKRVKVEKVPTRDLVGIMSMFSMGPPSNRPMDISVPLIMVKLPVKEKWALPIDGWHRIRFAAANGIQELPYVMLTAAEEKKIRIRG